MFSTRSMKKTSMAKMYETKRIIVAFFSVLNFEYEVKKIYREIKSFINLSTTKTMARRPKRYNKIIEKQTEPFKEGIKVLNKGFELSSSNRNVNQRKIFWLVLRKLYRQKCQIKEG